MGRNVIASAARHCLTSMPYRMVVFDRLDGNKTPLFRVGGSSAAAMGAEKALRAAYKLHGGDCFYCKKPVTKDDLSIDHVEPEKLGGSGSLQNLVIACKPCNHRKDHRPIEAFNPDAGREWLSAPLIQIQDRLNQL